MNRCVRRQVHGLNAGKTAVLQALIEAFALEKQYWLQEFAKKERRLYIKQHRVLRDAAVKEGYPTVSGLQARMWKLALVEAAQAWDKHWKATFAPVKSAIAKRKEFGELAKHYAYWLLSGYTQFFACLEGEAPPAAFDVDEAMRTKVAGFVHRKIRQYEGKQPSVRIARSVVLDADCYSVFAENNTQYLSIMTLEAGTRLVLPLKGHAAISGTIRVVLDGSQVEVHVSQKVRNCQTKEEDNIGLDFGYTEAFTDNTGDAYGIGLGKVLTEATEERSTKGKARNKLWQLQKKFTKSPDEKKRLKAKHIRRYNLGTQHLDKRRAKAQAHIECIINNAINTLVEARQPACIITEDLRHAFTFDKSRPVNRKLSAWTRGVLQDRVEFKAVSKGFRHRQVNAAYSSQMCPHCGYVDSKNRNGDTFLCLHCKHRGHADCVGAINVLSRNRDKEITLFTPYQDVKAILLKRFQCQLETVGSAAHSAAVKAATVQGMTLDVAPAASRRQPRGNSKRGGSHHIPGNHSKNKTQNTAPNE